MENAITDYNSIVLSKEDVVTLDVAVDVTVPVYFRKTGCELNLF